MIHKYKLLGLNIVLDVNSGSVHLVDELTYKLLDFMEDGNLDWHGAETLLGEYERYDIAEAHSEVRRLVEAGALFSDDWHEELADDWQKETAIKALCLHVAHDCNMVCEYCFANKGDYSGPAGLMPPKVGRRAIDFVISKSRARKNIEVDFFGGEPLLNFGAVREIVEYAKAEGAKHGKTFRFTITTNGIALNDEIKKYINQEMSNVVLSIDGRKEVNDKTRRYVGGGGTYEKIVPHFLEIAESRNQDNYYVRGTFTAQNLDFSKDVLHLADLGFKQISIEPVVAPKDVPYSIKEEHLPAIKKEYEKLAEIMVQREEEGRGFNFFHFMIDLEGGPCAIKRISGCGAGHEYLAVTPEGDIYPCHQFVGKAGQRMGSVIDGGFDDVKSRELSSLNVYTKEECKTCWARFYCSGGCIATSENYAGGMDKPYKIGCELEKKRVECAIALKIISKVSQKP